MLLPGCTTQCCAPPACPGCRYWFGCWALWGGRVCVRALCAAEPEPARHCAVTAAMCCLAHCLLPPARQPAVQPGTTPQVDTELSRYPAWTQARVCCVLKFYKTVVISGGGGREVGPKRQQQDSRQAAAPRLTPLSHRTPLYTPPGGWRATVSGARCLCRTMTPTLPTSSLPSTAWRSGPWVSDGWLSGCVGRRVCVCECVWI